MLLYFRWTIIVAQCSFPPYRPTALHHRLGKESLSDMCSTYAFPSSCIGRLIPYVSASSYSTCLSDDEVAFLDYYLEAADNLSPEEKTASTTFAGRPLYSKKSRTGLESFHIAWVSYHRSCVQRLSNLSSQMDYCHFLYWVTPAASLASRKPLLSCSRLSLTCP